jgi:LysM repeat protein
MSSSDENLPPDGPFEGAGADGDEPGPYQDEGYAEAPLSLEDAEARLRDFAALSDSEASFAGPDDETRRLGRREHRRGRRESRDERIAELHNEHYYGDYSHPTSVWRWLIRIAVPVVFLGGVIALVVVVLNSGILGGEAAVSPSPSASVSNPSPAATLIVYKVKKGDTLSQIAERFGTTVDKILEANPTIDINNLSVGTKLKIPTQQ